MPPASPAPSQVLTASHTCAARARVGPTPVRRSLQEYPLRHEDCWHRRTQKEDCHGTRDCSPRPSVHLERRHPWDGGLRTRRKHIGEIDHLIIDKVSGRVAYAVMSFGGFLGLGHSHYPIPWGALTYDKSLGGFRTNVTEQQLRDAPEFSDDSWQDRDWETRTHRHYGAPEYWETRTPM
jgi:PRC-barrel domain